jgi:hypothetical protein
LAQLLDFGFFLLSGRCGLFHSFILPAFATEVFFDLNPYGGSKSVFLVCSVVVWFFNCQNYPNASPNSRE